jgi:hypothetical protein
MTSVPLKTVPHVDSRRRSWLFALVSPLQCGFNRSVRTRLDVSRRFTMLYLPVRCGGRAEVKTSSGYVTGMVLKFWGNNRTYGHHELSVPCCFNLHISRTNSWFESSWCPTLSRFATSEAVIRMFLGTETSVSPGYNVHMQLGISIW